MERVIEVECSRIRPYKGQPRKYFDPKKMDALRASINFFGQKTPGKVRKLPSGSGHDFELINGERRFRVCVELGKKFKAILDTNKTELDDRQQFLEAVIANYGGESHTELETLEAITKVRNDFGYTLAETAAVFGASVGWVKQYLSLAKLHPKVLEFLAPELPDKQRLTFSHAVIIATLSPETQIQVASAVIEGRLKLKEVKHLVEHQTGKSTRVEGFSPRKEHELLTGFFKRTIAELGLLLKKPDGYFADMFEHRTSGDLESVLEMVGILVESLGKLKVILEETRKRKSRR